MSAQPQRIEPPAEAAALPAPPASRRRGLRIRNPLASLPRRVHVAEREIREGRFPDATYRRDAIYRRTLALADVASVALALLIGVAIVGDGVLNPLALLALPLVIVVSKLTGVYDRDEHLLKKTTLDEIPALFWVATLDALLIWLAGEAIVDGHFGRDQAIGVWALLFASMVGTRALARAYARAVSAEERCLVVGDARTAAWIRRRFEEAPGLKARVVGRVPLEPEPPGSNGRPVLGEPSALESLLEREEVERAIVAPRAAVSDDLMETILRLKSLGVKVSVLPRLFEVVGSSVELDDVDGIPLLGMHRYGLSRSSRAVKRALDVAGSAVGLLLLSPLLAAIAVAIKLDSPGPVLFRQCRMGRGDVPFELLKFRTMVDGAEGLKPGLAERNEADGGLFKIEADPRITRVGRLLRHASLDELPQLVNVLRGDMALVGPRPLVLDEDSRIEGWRRSRLELPPGMTGPWQVFGSARIPLHEMVEIDYLYGANWSLWLDVKILLRTIPFVFGGRGL